MPDRNRCSSDTRSTPIAQKSVRKRTPPSAQTLDDLAFELPVKAQRAQEDEMLPGMFTIVWSSFRARAAACGERSEVKRQCRRQASVNDFGIWRKPPKGASRARTGLTRVRVWDRSGPERDRSNESAPRARIGEYGGFRACTIVFASDWNFIARESAVLGTAHRKVQTKITPRPPPTAHSPLKTQPVTGPIPRTSRPSAVGQSSSWRGGVPAC